LEVASSQFDSIGHLIQLTDANGKPTAFAINETGQTETVTDRLGNPTTYSYDADGNILTMTDALGKTSSYTYDSNDNKLTETNPLGQTTTYTYDASSNRLSQTDPLGNKTSYTYNARGQVLTVNDPLSHTTTNVYDSNGNLTSTTDANGKTTSTVYGASGLPSSVTDAAGNTTQFQYDGSGNLTQQTDALGNLSTYTYDANNNKLSQTVTRTVNGQPQALTTSYAYDGNNRLTKTTYPDGTTTQVQYNSIGKQSVTIDQLGRQTSYTYDTLGRLTTTTYPDSTTQSTTYDAENDRLTSTDRAGHTTSYTYDADKRLTKTTYADNSFTQTVYDAAGRVSSTVDANNNTTSYGYDNAGRRTTLTDALTHVTTFAYDNSGNQISVKDARQNLTQYQYDALNRQIAVIYPDLTTSGMAYDTLGRVISKTDQAGKITGYGYDALGRLTSVTQDAATGGLNLVTSYGYDQVGNRISQTDANLHTTTYQYDQLGRRIGRTLPAGQSESYAYDAAGNLKSKADFNGKTTTYAYDTSNRLLTKTPDASFAANPITFTYFPNGLRQTMGDPSGTTTYAYDNRNRVTSRQTPFGTLSYAYDAGGDVLAIASSNANGASLTYTYDQLNRLSTVTDNRLLSQGATSGVKTYNYDAVGNLLNFVYPNGVTSANSYDTLNRLTQMGSSKNSSSISNYAYTLGVAGNRLTVAELSGRSVAYGYDSLYRLTSEAVTSDPHNNNGTISYTYDAVGNRKTLNSTLPPAGGMTYTYDADDRLGADTYDNDGNTINSSGTANTYDFENHMVQHGAATIVYDGDGNRVAETVAGVTTNYLVDPLNPTGYAQVVDELQGGAVTRSYSYGLERINENQVLNSVWTPSFYGYDGHGSVRQLTNSSGAVTDTYDYDAFGNLINSTGSTPNNYLFAGEAYDSALGLYYNRARYLNTTTGRFWSMDTYEGQPQDPLSLHKYIYADDSPTNNLDPSGNEVDVIGSFSVAATLDSMPSLNFQVIVATVKQSLPYNVVVVTLPTGSTYEPKSKVKNSDQAAIAGWPIDTPIRIAVPPGIDPQTMVDQWSSGGIWSRRSALNLRTWFAFKKFWSQPENDYKKKYGKIFDACANFEFGATGAAAFFGLPALQAAADYLHGGTNDPVNTADIQSGYEAIAQGGKLSTTVEKLAP
jgi:RHS repeat-associated protein